MNSYDTFYLDEQMITLPISWYQLSKKGFHMEASEEKKKYPNYKPISSYVWCKNNYSEAGGKILDTDKGIYVTQSYFHYLKITFDSHNDVKEIVFYFDCADEKKETE